MILPHIKCIYFTVYYIRWALGTCNSIPNNIEPRQLTSPINSQYIHADGIKLVNYPCSNSLLGNVSKETFYQFFDKKMVKSDELMCTFCTMFRK